MFARQRDPGLWTFDSVITPAELEYWDASIANAIDGAAGGAYSLSADVTIGGDPFVAWAFDLEVSFGQFTIFTAAVTFGDGVQFLDDIDVQGAAEFGDNVTFNDLVAFEDPVTFGLGADVLFNAPASFYGLTEYHDVATFHDDATFNGIVTFNDDATLNGNAFLNGSVVLGASSTQSLIVQAKSSLRAPMTMSGTGAISHRTALGGDADASFSPLACKDVVILSGILSGPVVYTIDDTGCLDDQEITFSNKDQSHTMQVKRPGGASLGANAGHWYRCKRIAGTWSIVEEGEVRA